MKFGSGDVQFQGIALNPAKVIGLCHHRPSCIPNRDKMLAYLVQNGVDLEQDFSLIFDADGNHDTLLLFGNPETLQKFQALVNALVTSTKVTDAKA